ncbi:MAG TPA: hypothetical protein VFN26_11615 [Candidatus Acidoferrum sp.]|nr:hypothetical protein [Candidatus Acidoferrum sp.]
MNEPTGQYTKCDGCGREHADYEKCPPLFEGLSLTADRPRKQTVNLFAETLGALLEYADDAKEPSASQEYRDECKKAAVSLANALRVSLDEFEQSLN